jgi:hypothetical protein
MFAVSGIMQAILLIMCLVWKARQRRLGIDDFGQPLVHPDANTNLDANAYADTDSDTVFGSPSPVARRADDVRGAVDEETVSGVVDAGCGEVVVEERTPLLGGGGGGKASGVKKGKKGGLLARFGW